MMATAYPLTWPAQFARTKYREDGRFKTELPSAIKNVQRSLEGFARDSGKSLKNLIISSNVTLGVNSPAAPGAPVPQGDVPRALPLAELVSKLRVASMVISNLPELPGYNGSILQIDDEEAGRIAKELDCVADALIAAIPQGGIADKSAGGA